MPLSAVQRSPSLVLLLAASCAVLGLCHSSWAGTVGPQTKAFAVAPFKKVHLVGNAEIHLHQDTTAEQVSTNVKVTGSAANLHSLVMQSSDGELYIDAGTTQYHHDLVIELSVGQLTEVVSEDRAHVLSDGLVLDTLAIEGHGLSRFDLQHLRVNDLTVVGAGNAVFAVSGAAQNQFVDMQGAGTYQALSLASQTGQVSVRGGGRVELWVEELLDVNVLGAAQVRYGGQPWVVQQVFGTGAIHRLDH
jgi:putative autotransporter adhesin-like protein